MKRTILPVTEQVTHQTPRSHILGALFHLTSPALPIGGFSYSQGLEAAVECGIVTNADDALVWMRNHLQAVVGKCEAVVWVCIYQALQDSDWGQVQYWNQWFWASRDTQEFRAETEQMGWSLAKLIKELDWGTATEQDQIMSIKPLTLNCAHAYACFVQQIPLEEGLQAYLFTWIENQVMASIKSIPLGQVAGQKILVALIQEIPALITNVVERAFATPPQISTFAAQLSILSARHEQQYSRLFRS